MMTEQEKATDQQPVEEEAAAVEVTTQAPEDEPDPEPDGKVEVAISTKLHLNQEASRCLQGFERCLSHLKENDILPELKAVFSAYRSHIAGINEQLDRLKAREG